MDLESGSQRKEQLFSTVFQVNREITKFCSMMSDPDPFSGAKSSRLSKQKDTTVTDFK